jgi:hypothetical protein
MLDSHNPIVRLFHTARGRLLSTSTDHYTIRIFGDVDTHGDVYSFPFASEIVGLVVGDIGDSDVGRDIIIEDRASNLQQINKRHHKFMAMQRMASTITSCIMKHKHLLLYVYKRQLWLSTMLIYYMIGLVISTHP